MLFQLINFEYEEELKIRTLIDDEYPNAVTR